MSKVLHTSLVGKMTYDEDQGYLIDGFAVADVMEGMNGLNVQFELVGYEQVPSQPANPDGPSFTPDSDFLKKLMDGPEA